MSSPLIGSLPIATAMPTTATGRLPMSAPA